MSTKNHAEIARWLLEEARTMPRNNDETSPAETLAIATAQVHATLALVEEQRMANRIALAVAVRADLKLGGSATDLSDWLHDGGGVLGYFSADEKEALGVA